MKKTKEETTVKKENKNKLVTNTLLIAVSALILVSAVQAFQFQKLANAISNGEIKTTSQPSSVPAGLPSQVGGCG